MNIYTYSVAELAALERMRECMLDSRLEYIAHPSRENDTAYGDAFSRYEDAKKEIARFDAFC